MECRTCGYALWNLTEPRCPECGSAFDLREYRFKPGTVAFGCPFCGALHEGGGECYLPSESDEAACRSCGQVMRVSQMRVVLLSDDAEAAPINVLPWQERARLGWWRAWLDTCKLSMAAPMTYARRIRPDASWTEAYGFAALTHGLGLLVQTIVFGVVWGVVMLVMLAAGAEQDTLMAVGFFGAILLAALAVGVVFSGLLAPLLIVGVWAGSAHLFLKITGPTQRGFNATAVTSLYAQGPMILQAIPVCGLYFNFIWQVWSLVIAILGVTQVQGVSGVRASFAFLWLWLLIFGLYMALVAVMIIAGEI
jgi:hypothetical protein